MSAVKAARSFIGWRRYREQIRVAAHRSDIVALYGLSALAATFVVAGVSFPGAVPHVAMLVPMFLGSMWLGPRRQSWFVIGCLAGACALLAVQDHIDWRTVIRVIVTFGIGLIILVTALRRSRLGVSAPRSESVFVDLRDRITAHGQLPDLGSEWLVESAWRSAGGTAFAGDFVVATHDQEAGTCDIVVVDVSGKGVDAGSRALLLSGALGGVLSAVPAESFLCQANRYLMSRKWDEGFATAIHLHLDLSSGKFAVRSAGHPPAILLKAGAGNSETLQSHGSILGLMDEADHIPAEGVLQPGDGLMLYTDGMVETTTRDISSGIDWLAGQGERLFQAGFGGGAQQIVDSLASSDDDRALVIVHRR